MKYLLLSLLFACSIFQLNAQDTFFIERQDTTRMVAADSVVWEPLRILNLNPFFTLHADSVLQYDILINKPAANYFWFLKSAPVGLKLSRQDGALYFKADKSYFKSGRLKYDVPYVVNFGVQNLQDPSERVDTTFSILFYNTEIILSQVKPTVSGTIYAEEGDSLRFDVQCETGSFPIEQITMVSNMPIGSYRQVTKCNDEFAWMVPYDFIREGDTAKSKTLVLSFVGADKFQNKDTALVRINIRPGIDFPRQVQVHKRISTDVSQYITELKLTFYAISANVKKNKRTRTVFDISGSSTALAGTIIATSAKTDGAKDAGKILPSIGLTLVPVKEAVAPNKIQEQNTATQIRTVVRRLEYLLSENQLTGDRDPEILAKTKKLQDELKQARLQLVDLPMVEHDPRISREDAERYFSDPKVNKRYRLKTN